MKKLYEFQKEAIESISQYKNVLLAWQMRTGKTFRSIELAKTYKMPILVCLVLKSTVGQWIDELRGQMPDAYVSMLIKRTKTDGIASFIECSEKKHLP